MEIIREFSPTDRYLYDFDVCSTSKGYAQIDTSQDAHYFGQWANPEKMIIVQYIEGDVIISKAANIEEFRNEIISMKQWNNENGYAFGIDPGFNDAVKQGFISAGLAEFLH